MSILDQLVADKIKKNGEKRQSEAIFDLIHAQVASEAKSQGKTPEEIEDISKKMEKVSKVGFSPTEAIAIGKAVAPDAFMDETAKAIKDANLQNAQNRNEDRFQKSWEKIVKSTDPMLASSRSTLGMAANANLRADRARATLNNPLLTFQDAQNVVADIAGIYAGGAPTDQIMSHSEYASAQSTLANAQQFLTGKPQDAVPKDIKQHIVGVLNDLQKVNNQALEKHIRFQEKANGRVISRYQDEWNQIKSELLNTGNDSRSTDSKLPPKSSAPKGAKGWDTEKGDWVF